MRVMQTTQLMDLFSIIGSHFQQVISQAVDGAVYVQIVINSGESEYESSCAYYLFLFSGWWFNEVCTDVALNGKYNPSDEYLGFRWYSQATNFIYPNRSEMKIRRQ
jgi:hypothetical protein